MKHRHNILRPLTASAALLFGVAGCQTHDCRCYLLERWGNVRVQHTLIDQQTPCADLGWDFPHPNDSSFRFCTDWDAPEMDTMDVVRMFWGQ